jgi:hypothetical protein
MEDTRFYAPYAAGFDTGRKIEVEASRADCYAASKPSQRLSAEAIAIWQQ